MELKVAKRSRQWCKGYLVTDGHVPEKAYYRSEQHSSVWKSNRCESVRFGDHTGIQRDGSKARTEGQALVSDPVLREVTA